MFAQHLSKISPSFQCASPFSYLGKGMYCLWLSPLLSGTVGMFILGFKSKGILVSGEIAGLQVWIL